MSVIQRSDLYPVGTTVKFFQVPSPIPGDLIRGNTGDPETWKPQPTKIGTAIVASDGSLIVETTSGSGPVLCYASVSSKDVYLLAYADASQAKVTVNTTSTQIVAANANREGLQIENVGPTNVLYLGLGTPAVLEQGIGSLAVGQSWDGRVSGKLYKGAVFGIAQTAAVAVAVQET